MATIDYRTTGIVTAPDVLVAVSQLLGTNIKDVGTLDLSTAITAIFSACKPMDSAPTNVNNHIVMLTAKERAECMWGLSLYTYKGSYDTFINEVSALVDGRSGTSAQRLRGLIEYDKQPTGNAESPFRLHDFLTPDRTSGYNIAYTADGKRETYQTHESLALTFPYCSFPSSTGGTGYFWDCANNDDSFSLPGLTVTDYANLKANIPVKRLDIASLVYWWQQFLGAEMNRYVRYQCGSTTLLAKISEKGTEGTNVKYSDVAAYVESAGAYSTNISSIEFYCDASTLKQVKDGSHTFFYIPYSYAISDLTVSHSIVKNVIIASYIDTSKGSTSWVELTISIKSPMNLTFGSFSTFDIMYSEENVANAKEPVDGWAEVDSLPSRTLDSVIGTKNITGNIYALQLNKADTDTGGTGYDFSTLNSFYNLDYPVTVAYKDHTIFGIENEITLEHFQSGLYIYLHYTLSAPEGETRMNGKTFDKILKYTLLSNE